MRIAQRASEIVSFLIVFRTLFRIPELAFHHAGACPPEPSERRESLRLPSAFRISRFALSLQILRSQLLFRVRLNNALIHKQTHFVPGPFYLCFCHLKKFFLSEFQPCNTLFHCLLCDSNSFPREYFPFIHSR